MDPSRTHSRVKYFLILVVLNMPLPGFPWGKIRLFPTVQVGKDVCIWPASPFIRTVNFINSDYIALGPSLCLSRQNGLNSFSLPLCRLAAPDRFSCPCLNCLQLSDRFWNPATGSAGYSGSRHFLAWGKVGLCCLLVLDGVLALGQWQRPGSLCLQTLSCDSYWPFRTHSLEPFFSSRSLDFLQM